MKGSALSWTVFSTQTFHTNRALLFGLIPV